jgi:hypothetical protein
VQKANCNANITIVESIFFKSYRSISRVARFLKNTQIGKNYTKLPQNIPNGHKIFPMAVK